jgi:glutaredoxin
MVNAETRLGYSCLTNIVIYGKDNCAWCEKAKDLLAEIKVTYIYHNLNQSNLTDFKQKNPNIKTVPAIWINDTYIGGYQELSQWVVKYLINGDGNE